MPNSYSSWRTGLQIDNIYPVGCIYMSVNSTNPGQLFGGTWEQIEDTFLLCAGSTYLAGSTGGSATHTHSYNHTHTTNATTTGATTLTTTQMPAHTHDKGSYSITGMIRCYSEYNKGNSSYDSNGVSGAFYFRTGTDAEYGTTTNMASGSNDAVRNVQFQANRSWSGVSGSAGGGGSHTHSQVATTSNGPNVTDTNSASSLPPYLAVYVFKRIS